MGSTQPLTEMGKCGPCVGRTPYHIHVLIFLKSGSLQLLEPSGPVEAFTEIALAVYLVMENVLKVGTRSSSVNKL